MNDNLNNQLQTPDTNYVILDPYGRFFQGFTDYIPEVVHDFVNHEFYAVKFDSLEKARKALKAANERTYHFYGNEKLPKGYLRIAKIVYEEVA